MKYSFADCVLDAESYSLARNGQPVAVEPQVFDLLLLLARNAGRLVTKDQIIAEIWNGRIVSEATISARVNAARKAVGDTGKEQKVIRTVTRRGLEMIVPVTTDAEERPVPSSKAPQTVRFTRSSDGTRIAYAASGSGPPLLRAGHFLTHLEKDWRSPVWRPYIEALGARHTLIRYDQRGTGLSDDRLGDISVESYASDLLAVADAAGLERFPIVASSQGAPAAIRAAATHPDRISRMVLYGGFAQGRAHRDPDFGEAETDALLTMIRSGWGNPKSAFMTAFTTLFCPGASRAELDNLVEIQLASASPENAARIRVEIDHIDVSNDLEKVRAPTLVIHASNDSVHPVSQGRLIAAAIEDAEFLQVESDNHIYLPSDPAWKTIVDAQLEFLNRGD
ncbi:alpha/beta hydrolase [Hoeflea sp. WL0058]|uniref:Alpha/beta hydrolase n=1 Tax=Flavimaribacter sediminis TaxID=2865987 RepID=A0AAE3CYF6_9HYPH|nr:alpha/beta fold hydrolase [Flavimaribacter sediminis]MBW8635604.1 alpha/beta hydrolase [Flavimaribacter sediminis]